MFRLQSYAFAHIIQTLPKPEHFRLMILFNSREIPIIELQRARCAIHFFIKVSGAIICEFSPEPFKNAKTVGRPGGFPIFGFMDPNTQDCSVDAILDDFIGLFYHQLDFFSGFSVTRSDKQEISIESLQRSKMNKSNKRKLKKKRAKITKKNRELNNFNPLMSGSAEDDKSAVTNQLTKFPSSASAASDSATRMCGQVYIHEPFNYDDIL